MKKITLLLSTLLLTQTLSAQSSTVNNTLPVAKKVTQKLLSTLQKNLKMHMKKGGPLAAAKFCNLKAMILTQDVDKTFGDDIHVKRISFKTRNPTNTPTDSEREILEKLQTLHATKSLPKFFIDQNSDSLKFYKPLIINKPVCLKCHGNIHKNSNLGQFLQEYYPQDKAINYKMHNFRGAVVVEIKNR